LVLRARALAASGQSAQAYGLLGPLRQQQALSESRLSELETRLAAASLHEASDGNALAERWDALSTGAKSEPRVVIAYAERAAAQGWDEAAIRSIENALDARWDERLAAHYARLPVGRLAARRASAERWLSTHPSSPALLLALARLLRQQGDTTQADDYLSRALAQGAGGDAWEESGHACVVVGDDTRARIAYANALRASRGEAVEQGAAPSA
ncbi:MAG: heme biosynthesis protein HemY, partial [Luteimonas sp.]